MGSNVFQRLDGLTWARLASVLLFGLILFTCGYAARKPVSVGQYLLIVLALAVFYPLFLYLSKHLRVSSAFWLSYLALGVLVLYNLQRRQGLRFALGYGSFGLGLLPGLFTAAALVTKGAGALVMIGTLLLVGFIMVVVPLGSQGAAATAAASAERPAAPRRGSSCRGRAYGARRGGGGSRRAGAPGRAGRRRSDPTAGAAGGRRGAAHLLRLLRRGPGRIFLLLSPLRQERRDCAEV